MKIKGNIDVIVKYFYPVAAGIETNILETYTVLVKKGWKVTIHTSKDTLTEKNVLPGRETIRGLTIIRYPYKKLGYFPKINWDKTDLVCLHNFNVLPHLPIMFYSLIRKMFRKKKYALTLTPHGGFNPEWSIFPSITAFVKRTYHFTLGTYLINAVVDGVRAVSEWEKEAMISKKVKPHLVETISNGIENDAYSDVDKLASENIKKQVKTLGRYLIQIGRVYVIKNYETTIKAMVNLPKDVKFVIAGPIQENKTYFNKLNKLIHRLKLENRVIFTGVIRGIDKYYLIKHAAMMVHMAIWESFCNVVHEGMSQGLVCIVANNTALPYLVKDGKNGYLVNTKDHETLSKKINYVLDNIHSSKIKMIQKNNQTFGLQESWQNVANKMDVFYCGLRKVLILKTENKRNTNNYSSSLIRNLPLFRMSLFNHLLIKKVIKKGLLLSIIFLILTTCLKGLPGNPSENHINNPEWLKKSPFDLSPERGRYALLMSIVDNKSFYFSLPIARFATPDLGYKNGEYISLFAPGISYIVAPGYILGKNFNLSQVGAYSIITLFGLLNFILIRLISKKLGATNISATLASLIFLFATPAFTYATTLYQHHVSTFLILASIYLFIKYKSIISTLVIWFLFAASIPVDYPNLFLMMPIIIATTLRFFNLQNIKEYIYLKINWKYLISLSGIILPVVFFFWFNWQSYGNPLQLSGTVASVNAIDELGKPTQPKNFEFTNTLEFTNPDIQKKSAVKFFSTRKILNGFYIHLFSPDRGIISYTPTIILSIVGVIIMFYQKNKILNIFLGILGTNLLLYSMWGDPYGGWAFGSRYLIPTYAITSIFLSLALSKFNRKIIFLISLFFTAIYSLAINTLGALTSIANPPKVEVLALEKLSGTVQKYTFERNWDFLLSDNSKSFLFQSYFHNYLSAFQYYCLILGIILIIFIYLFISLIKQPNENNHQ